MTVNTMRPTGKDNPVNTFTSWLSEWSDEIEQTQLFSRSEMPSEPTAIRENLSRTVSEYARMGALLADAERYVVLARAAASLEVKREHDDLNANERKAVVEADISDVVRTRDILQAMVAALKERGYALMNGRRFAEAEMRMTRGHEG